MNVILILKAEIFVVLNLKKKKRYIIIYMKHAMSDVRIILLCESV